MPQNSKMLPKELADQYYSQAQNHYRLGNNQKAILQITKSIDIYPQQIYYIFRSKCHTTSAHVAESIKDAEQAIQLNQQQPEAFYVRAEANFYAGEFEFALVDFYSAITMRNHDERDAKGLNKCIEGIKNACCVGRSKIDHYINLLDTGRIVERSLLKGADEFDLVQYCQQDSDPLKQLYESELITATEYAHIDNESSESSLGDNGVIKNYCHVTDDKLFLQKVDMPIIAENVEMAVDYIQNREIFWKNQSKTVIKNAPPAEKIFKHKIDNTKPNPPNVQVREQHKIRSKVTKENIDRKIKKIPKISSLQIITNNKIQLMAVSAKNYEHDKSYQKAENMLLNILLLTNEVKYKLKLSKIYFKQQKFTQSQQQLEQIIYFLYSSKQLDNDKSQILIDSLCMKAEINKQLDNYQEAQQILKEAEKIAILFKDQAGIKFIQNSFKSLQLLTKQELATKKQFETSQKINQPQSIKNLTISDIQSGKNEQSIII